MNAQKKRCVVLTGAGISADSGLSTFRGTGGLWEGHRIEDVATPEGFKANPQLVIDFYNQRRLQLKEVEPNAAHLALKRLEDYFITNIITQNVDDLHERAGSSNILHLHGELKKLRSSVNENYIIDFCDSQDIAMTDPDGNPMRPHIVWFGEAVPALDEAISLVQQADIVLIIGTSLQVYPAAGLMNFAPKHAIIHLIDLHPVQVAGVHITAKRASEGVPEVVDKMISQFA
ncbi:MAG: NAD-dependent deacylase [Neisseriaceae bacterium]|nr:NAD-dependent deacylase [Neisseriaceae bacterium]